MVTPMNYEHKRDKALDRLSDAVNEIAEFSYVYGLYAGMLTSALTTHRDAENIDFAE